MSQSDNIYRVDSNDQHMDMAAQLARKTFRYFYREVAWEQRRIVPGLEICAIKVEFSDPEEMRTHQEGELEKEFMWVMEVDFDGKQIYGTLQNDPHSLKSIKAGDRVKIPGKQLVDWLYVQLGETYGGFTIDQMRSRMSKSERKAHDNAWGLDFGEPGFVKIVPDSYLGEASPKKKGLFSFLGGEKPKPQDYNQVSQFEHPMSVNMRDSLEEAIRKNPSFLTATNDFGFTMLHQLALAGSYDGVDVCLKMGFNPKQVAPNGMTPYRLAKSLGWPKVMDRLTQAGAGE
jgi:uncharacterized protein YegJ (DUF2314 family)